MASGTTFFHYQDAQGVEVIVQSLDDVPANFRAQVKRVDLGKEPALAAPREVQAQQAALPLPTSTKEYGRSIHWPSFAAGAAISLVAGMAFVLLLRRHARLLSLLVGVLAMMAFGIGYLTLLRRQVGLPSAGLSTPATILDDARGAAAAAQKRFQQDEKTLDQINNMR
jgi:hypothetical protein